MSAANDDRPADDIVAPAASSEDAVVAGFAELIQRGRSGADWFFWIAALSLINTVIAHSGGDRNFVIGLGVTQIVDGIAKIIANDHPETQSVAIGVAIGFSAFCSLVAAAVGYLARNRWQILFGLGMFVYLLDGLLFVLVQDWMSLGFHAFALFCMWSGFSAFQQLASFEKQLATADAV
jgi:hypothetical protein